MLTALDEAAYGNEEAERELKNLRALCRLKPEDFGLPPYPEGDVIGPCVCGSWPSGKCLQCPVTSNVKLTGCADSEGVAKK